MANEADAAKDRLIKQLETENEQLNEQLKGRIELLGLDEQIDSETQFDSIIVGKMDRSSDDIQF
ncbi:MAG: hypothetical protein RLZZ139_4139 [Cyanobacteriota bacterium]|jgi:hypothetical protein